MPIKNIFVITITTTTQSSFIRIIGIGDFVHNNGTWGKNVLPYLGSSV
jgi:hypothetical protein